MTVWPGLNAKITTFTVDVSIVTLLWFQGSKYFLHLVFYFQILDEPAKNIFFIIGEENDVRGGNGHPMYYFNNDCRYVRFKQGLIQTHLYYFIKYFRHCWVIFMLAVKISREHTIAVVSVCLSLSSYLLNLLSKIDVVDIKCFFREGIINQSLSKSCGKCRVNQNI
jgi:hypothetical protein